jgi:predicted RNase H-like HicB family nuclease
MKRFIYPMVLFTDEDDLYTALYPDLNLLASGSSIEDVFARASDYLNFYVVSVLKYDAKFATQSTYAEIQALNPKKIVLLGTAEVEEDNIVLTEQEQEEKSFLNEFVFTEDND